MGRKVLLLVVTEDWYLASHRLPLVRAATAAGWRVVAATRVRDHGSAITSAGAELVSLPLARESRSAVAEFRAVRALHRLYREVRPDVVHHVGIKPMLYGGWAARRAGVRRVVQAFAGLGHLYTDGGGGPATRRLFELLLRPVTRRRCTAVLVQNDADGAVLIDRRLAVPTQLKVIRGGGVDLERFVASPLPTGTAQVVLPARMLATKGVREFVAAARRARQEGLDARFVLAGRRDEANPDALTLQELEAWAAEGVVEWRDHVEEMPRLLQESVLVVLPSYREGMPKALLEAAASGRAIVTTDVPGCRDVVEDGVNGVLVPARDARALADATIALLRDRARLTALGAAGRRRAEREFSDVSAAVQTVALYEELLLCSP